MDGFNMRMRCNKCILFVYLCSHSLCVSLINYFIVYHAVSCHIGVYHASDNLTRIIIYYFLF